ncbi:hypothetical protein BH11MYX3_BH11MYX3_45470 [soil metagenome]
MVASSASQVPAFTPGEHPQVAISSDGSLAVISESSRAVVLELPGGAAFAEIGIDPEATASEVAWLGAFPRLLVLSRYAAHSSVHLIDPHGPRTIAEIRLEAPMRLFATVGSHALAVGTLGAAVLTATDTHLTPYQFPARSIPVTAGAAGGNFLVALAGAIEEWDPQSRMPKRRLRLSKPAVITAVGGSDRVVWMVTQNAPSRIDVIPLVNRGQPKTHELPEPIAHVAGHPRSDLIACVGAESGKVYLVDLDGRHPRRVLGTETVDHATAAGLANGRMVGVIVAQANRPIAIVPLDGRDTESQTQVSSRPAGLDDTGSEPAHSTLGDDEPDPANDAHAQDKAPRSDGAMSWRDELVSWSRAVMAGTAERGCPSAPAIETAAAQLALAPALVPGLALLYGAHLGGVRGAAPVDVARVLGGLWHEALGTGQLARKGAARYLDSRVMLAEAVQRMLDELPPATGTMFGSAGAAALLGPCVVVSDEPLAVLAQRYLATVGSAILAAHPDCDPVELFLEARARGAVPMLRFTSPDLVELPTEPVVLVVTDDAVAEQLGVPRLYDAAPTTSSRR